MPTEAGQKFFEALMEGKARIEADPDEWFKAVTHHLQSTLEQAAMARDCIKAGNALEAGSRRRWAEGSLHSAKQLLATPFALEKERGLAD